MNGLNATYVVLLRQVVRLSLLAVAVYAGLLALTYLEFKQVPLGFIPQQDQGYLVVALVLPDASAIDRTDAVLSRLSDIAMKVPGIEGTFAITGLNLLSGTNQTNAATMFLPLKHFSKRNGKPAESAEALSGYLMGEFGRIQEGFSLVLMPPPVQGIGQAGGFKMQVEDRSGRATPQQLQAATDALIAAAGKDPQIAALFTSFRAGVPQLYANVDRVKARRRTSRSPTSFKPCRFTWAVSISTSSTTSAGPIR